MRPELSPRRLAQSIIFQLVVACARCVSAEEISLPCNLSALLADGQFVHLGSLQIGGVQLSAITNIDANSVVVSDATAGHVSGLSFTFPPDGLIVGAGVTSRSFSLVFEAASADSRIKTFSVDVDASSTNNSLAYSGVILYDVTDPIAHLEPVELAAFVAGDSGGIPSETRELLGEVRHVRLDALVEVARSDQGGSAVMTQVTYGFGLQQILDGDTDLDGDVDLADLNNVRNHFGETGDVIGDTDGDEVVGLADLNNVRNDFGSTSNAQVVSEPASSALSLVCAFCAVIILVVGRCPPAAGGNSISQVSSAL